MFTELDTYDWSEVFGEGTGGNCTPIIPSKPPFDKTTSTVTFSREDVSVIFGMADGERDKEDWVVYGKLNDGRFFVARGGCDYTGWDCQARNSGDVASTLEHIITFGLTPRERIRLGL